MKDVTNKNSSEDVSLLMTCRFVAFIAMTDLARARQFYENVLGLSLKEQNEFACTFDSNGTMLRITKVPTLSKAEYAVASWVVPNIEEAVRNLMRRGIRFERYLSLEQDDLGVWASPVVH